MRKLKVKLADNKDYILTSLTLKESVIAKKMQQESDKLSKRMDELLSKEDDLTPEENRELDALMDTQVDKLITIIRISLSKEHKEFVIGENNDEEKINEKIKELIDMRDLKRLSSFAIIGALRDEEDEQTVSNDIIDLTDVLNEEN